MKGRGGEEERLQKGREGGRVGEGGKVTEGKGRWEGGRRRKKKNVERWRGEGEWLFVRRVERSKERFRE